MPASDRDPAQPARTDPQPVPAAGAATERAAGDELDSRTLFAAGRRRVILHQGERYCLQLTRAGKLLLTK